MSNSIPGGMQDPVTSGTQHVAGGVHHTLEQAEQVAGRAQDGVTEIRAVIRGQPITAALVVFALGYLFGRLGSLIPSGSSRRA